MTTRDQHFGTLSPVGGILPIRVANIGNHSTYVEKAANPEGCRSLQVYDDRPQN